MDAAIGAVEIQGKQLGITGHLGVLEHFLNHFPLKTGVWKTTCFPVFENPKHFVGRFVFEGFCMFLCWKPIRLTVHLYDFQIIFWCMSWIDSSEGHCH